MAQSGRFAKVPSGILIFFGFAIAGLFVLLLLLNPSGPVAASRSPASAQPTPAVKPPSTPPCSRQRPCLAILIDDMGRDLRHARQLLELPLELSLSVLPHALHSKEVARRIRKAGRELWLHLPMAPKEAQQITDEPVFLSLKTDISPFVIDALSRVGPVSGVNNHMGSAFSEDCQAADRLMKDLAARGLRFLDSRTSPRSCLCQAAKGAGVECLERNVFLDDPGDSATVDYRLDQALELARRRGVAIAIGHPSARTLGALERLVQRLNGVRLVRLSRFFRGGP